MDPTIDFKRIAVDIPDSIINSMIVTTGPRFEYRDFGNGFNKSIEIQKSIFKDKLKYIYCDKCKENNKLKK